MSRDWIPRLSDVRVSLDLIARHSRAGDLEGDAFRALTGLVSACAGRLVWTMTPADDGSLPDDDALLHRYAFVSKRRWAKIRPLVEVFFDIRDGRWHLNEPWLAVDSRPLRFAIPAAIQEVVLAREGRACTYCGDTEGPFDFDHIFPVCRGGTNDPSNLAFACASCNRSKGAKTLREWAGR